MGNENLVVTSDSVKGVSDQIHLENQRNHYGLSAKHKEDWVNNNDSIAYLESVEVMTERDDWQELQEAKGVQTADC